MLPALSEDGAQPIFTHRNKRLARSHQVPPIEVIHGAERSRRDPEHHYPAMGVCHFLHVYAKAKRLMETLSRCHDVAKRLRADNRARSLVCDPKQQMSAAFVCECHAVLA